jgi:hypothetical protein
LTKRKDTSGAKKEDPNWKRLEKIVADIQKTMAPGAKVEHNHYVIGKSGRRRQLDVTISKKIGAVPIFVVIECKRYTRRVGIGLVEQFAKKLEDVRASSGVMISNTGFDAGAKAIATQENILLRTFREAGEIDWNRMFTTAEIVLTEFDLKDKKISVKLAGYPVAVEATFGTILLRENGEDYVDVKPKRFAIRDLFWDWWDERAARPRKIGPIEVQMSDPTPAAYVKIQDNRLVQVENITLTGTMSVSKFVKKLSLSRGRVIDDTETNNPDYLEVQANPFSTSGIKETEEEVVITPEEWEKMDHQTQSGMTAEEGYDYRLTFAGGNY